MHPFSHLALPGVILISALGALIMCVLVLLYGFPSPRGEEDDSGALRRLVITRLGHAAAGVLFTMVILFTVVHVARQAREGPAVPGDGSGRGASASAGAYPLALASSLPDPTRPTSGQPAGRDRSSPVHPGGRQATRGDGCIGEARRQATGRT